MRDHRDARCDCSLIVFLGREIDPMGGKRSFAGMATSVSHVQEVAIRLIRVNDRYGTVS